MGKQQKKIRKKVSKYSLYAEEDREYLIECLVLATSEPLFFSDPLFQNQYTMLINVQDFLVTELERLKTKEITKKKWQMLKEVYRLQREMVNLLSDYVELNRLDPVEYVEQEKEDSELDYANYSLLLQKKVKKYQKRKEEENFE